MHQTFFTSSRVGADQKNCTNMSSENLDIFDVVTGILETDHEQSKKSKVL